MIAISRLGGNATEYGTRLPAGPLPEGPRPGVYPDAMRTLLPARLCLLSCLALAACAPASPRPSLLLLTLDTTRVDALGSYGAPEAATPHLDRLAAESRRFTQAITTAPYTGPSHASMLTGLIPPRHGLRDFLGQALPDSADTLAEILSAHGYATAAFVSAYVLDPRYGLAQGFDTYEAVQPPEPPLRFSERRGGTTAGLARAWLRDRDPERPFFVWLHLFDPHRPYVPPARFRQPLRGEGWEAERQRYAEEVAYMDTVVGELFAELAEQAVWDELVVAALADHGEMLGEHGMRPGTHSPSLYDTTLRVPLLLRAPGRVAPGVEQRQVSVVDVFPTLLAIAGVPVPPGLDGRRLEVAPPEPRAAYSETFYADFPEVAEPGRQLVSLRHDGWKLVLGPGREELYHVRADPGETRDLADREPGRLAELRERLGDELGAGARHAPGSLSLSPEEEREHRAHLRALGYIAD